MLGWGQGAPAAPCISRGRGVSAWLSRFPPWQTPLNNLPGSPNAHFWSLSALLHTTHPFPRQDGMWGAQGVPKPGAFLQFSSVLLCSKTQLGARQCQGMATRCTGMAKLIHPAQIYNPLGQLWAMWPHSRPCHQLLFGAQEVTPTSPTQTRLRCPSAAASPKAKLPDGAELSSLFCGHS